jgi:RNA polymerase sigma-70 factor (sigma-E family)
MQFEEFVRTSGPALLRYAYVLTGGDAHSAEDLVQSTLVTAYRKWSKVSVAANLDAYMRRIATNLYIDASRRRSSQERPSDVVVEEASTAPDPAQRVADREDLRQRLAALGPRAHSILVMRYYVDLSDADIAKALSISESTVRATASRALQSLRRQSLPETARRPR